MQKDSFEYDILTEVFNIGVGKAADMLSQMLNKRISLDVPSLNIQLDGFFSGKTKGAIMVSAISFQDELNGEANLIFPTDKMRTIINICIEEDLNPAEDLGFTDIDFDVIKEIGNVILNSLIGEMGNLLEKNLEYTLPIVEIFETTDYETRIKAMKDMHSLFLVISFLIDDLEVEGAVIINFTSNSLVEIMKTVNRMEEHLYG